MLTSAIYVGSLWLLSFASPYPLTREFVTTHFSLHVHFILVAGRRPYIYKNAGIITVFIVSVTNFPIVMGSPYRSATLLACDHVGSNSRVYIINHVV